jgi:hypothetical protein
MVMTVDIGRFGGVLGLLMELFYSGHFLGFLGHFNAVPNDQATIRNADQGTVGHDDIEPSFLDRFQAPGRCSKK